MAVTLTDRYVGAAMRTVPERQRADLATELRASIDDQVEARVAAGEEAAAAERAVLTDLGDPDALAAGYTDRPLHLIGPKYYLTWWRLLKLLLWIVIPSAAFAVALGQTLAGAPFGAIVGSTIGITITAGVHLCFWVTLVFAFIEYWEGRTGEQTAVTEWSLDDLPEPRENSVGFTEMVVGIAWLIIVAGFILWDHFLGFIPGETISFLDPGLWPWWIGALFVVMAVSATFSVIVYAVGRWTYPLAATNAVLAVIVAVPALWLLSQDRLINPAFWDAVLDDAGADVPGILNVIFGFVIAGIAVWSIIDGFLNARRAAQV
ncbi:MAG TPA: permease prefix domain 1-containing protein [Agromyces sp.]